jgi:hypothetical protein
MTADDTYDAPPPTTDRRSKSNLNEPEEEIEQEAEEVEEQEQEEAEIHEEPEVAEEAKASEPITRKRKPRKE